MATITDIDSSTENRALLQNIQNHLVLVLHAHECLKREQQPTNTNQTSSQNICTLQHCATMRNVLLHMKQCYDLQNCSYPDCLQSRSVIFHWKNCTTLKCSICRPLRKVSTVERIVKILLNIFQVGYRSLTSDQLAKMKELAEKIENDAFGAAISVDDYSKRAMNHVATIRETCAKKRLLKKQEILTTTSAPSNQQDSSNGVVPPSENQTAKTKPSIVDRHLLTTSGMSTNDYSISATTTEINKKEQSDLELGKPDGSASINTVSKSLPKYPAVFSIDDIRDKMRPVLRHLYDQEEGVWFREPVTEADAPDYFNIIKHPMDFSTMFKKLDENQYTTPFQFCDDMWLVFNNTWTYNKKATDVYRAAEQLAKLFMESVDPIMKNFGYCCGRQYIFLPPAMFCHTSDCRISRDGDYFVYNNPDSSRNNLSGDKYTFCKKCFDSMKSKYMLVGDDPAQTLVKLLKADFHQAKNDHQESEAMIDCIVCTQRFHNICVLYHEHIWPQGYVCEACRQKYNIKRKDNRYLARELPTNDLSNRLEKCVDDFIKDKCAGRVTIRVLAASDRVCEVKTRFKKHFGTQVPDSYSYRTKVIFAFQEIEGVDVVLFGMHVQEYDSQRPGPNSKRVYISYLDSVHYFQPEDQRTPFYHRILIGYLEYVQQLGFTYAYIWACPPKKGDDYIFYCHPVEQRIPGPERLQKWYKDMFEAAKFDYQNLEDYAEINIKSATDIPYFDGDYWPNKIEDLLKELEPASTSDNVNLDNSIEPEEPTESSSKRKLNNNSTHKKKKLKKTTSECEIADLLFNKIKLIMKKQTKSFFVVRLCNSMSNPATLTDRDPLIRCDLMESRDAFLSFAHDNHCEFSTLRRAKYSTMVLLMKLQHEHRMERVDEASETSTILIDTIRHAIQCRNKNCTFDNCALCKQLIQHLKSCTKVPRKQCSYCKRFLSPIWIHAKTCTDQNCRLPYCAAFKSGIQQQRIEPMHQAQIVSGSSSHGSQSSATTTD